MIRLLMTILFAITLSSCNTPEDNTAYSSQIGADGYRFEQKQMDRRSFKVNVVVYTDANELRRAAAEALGPNPNVDPNYVVAFSVIKSSSCTIHMMDPEVSYEPEFIGHEFTHCVYGQFHNPYQ